MFNVDYFKETEINIIAGPLHVASDAKKMTVSGKEPKDSDDPADINFMVLPDLRKA